jgi:hypothetical protein
MNFLKGLFAGVLLSVALAAASDFYIGYNPNTGLIGLPGGLVDVSPPQAITGCSITGLVGGTTAGQFTAGATTCTVSLTDVAAPHGYTCLFIDMTHPATFRQVTSTTTGCQAVGVVTLSDVIVYLMVGY